MVIEIKYSNIASPSLYSLDSEDKRSLSVFYKSININSIMYIDFSKESCSKLFGFYSAEKNGTWSAGRKSCLFLPDIVERNSRLELILDAHPFSAAFKTCRISIKTSAGHRGWVKITEKGHHKISLKKPLFFKNKRLVIGDFSKIQHLRNVSLFKDIPKVSIILLNHEKSQMTRLASVAAASSDTKVPCEILCVDNGSSQESLSDLKEREVPIKILELGENLGFGLANNRAALEARGEYLLFLNNDAFVDEGAIDELLGAFRNIPYCRIVGSVLRFADGTMQEAGATLQPDGHPIRHGRHDQKFNPRKLPRFQPVDYVSGACLMIRKADFLEMGGFDEKYSPAYYEDTDLCMRSLLYGQKVYLASRANCYHIENATTSTIEDSAWATRTAETHREIFLKDWGPYLASRNPKDLAWHLRETKQMTSDGTD